MSLSTNFYQSNHIFSYENASWLRIHWSNVDYKYWNGKLHNKPWTVKKNESCIHSNCTGMNYITVGQNTINWICELHRINWMVFGFVIALYLCLDWITIHEKNVQFFGRFPLFGRHKIICSDRVVQLVWVLFRSNWTVKITNNYMKPEFKRINN